MHFTLKYLTKYNGWRKGGSNQQSFSFSGSDEFPVGFYRHLLISYHLDKFWEINETIPITVSLLHHVYNLLLSKSLTKVDHTGAEFIEINLPIAVLIKGS